MVARLDGCLDFLGLSGPTGSCHFSSRDNESSTVNRSSPRNKKKTSNDYGVGVRERAPSSVIDCHLIHRVRAHLKPVSLLRVLGGKVITGSQDRTIKVCYLLPGFSLGSPKSVARSFLRYCDN